LVDIYMPASEFAKTELMRRSCISSGKIELVPESISQLGGPDPSIYESNELPKLAAMIARLFPHKGHSVLIEALAELKKRGLNIKVKLIGGGNDAKLKDDAALLGVLDNLEFCGFVENIYPVIKAVPVILLPSDMEGMPICVIEAMSVRKLVAASSVGGVPEIIKDGFNGFLHPPQNPSALADILEKIYKSPPGEFDRIRENGYKTWLEKFQLSSMIDGFIRVYRKL
ncbi:MAG: glycosyltransferase family 4 protein, partial [Elusimicrobia bacterium]|nr:glycosyltransferase family 4 protein [Elusimicrobiota bacterium]